MRARLSPTGLGCLLTAMALGACAWPSESGCPPHGLLDCDEVIIQIAGTVGERTSIELLDQAIVVDPQTGGGLGEFTALDGGTIRVYEVDTCALLATFPVAPYSIHRISFHADDAPTVEPVDPATPIEMGPGFEAVELSGCTDEVSEDEIRAILPGLDEMRSDGLITLERVEVLTYHARLDR